MTTPYYQGEHATLYLGDCREIVPTLPRQSVDLIIADPPYGVGWQSGWRRDQFKEMAGDDGTIDWPIAIGDIVRRLLPHRRHAYTFGYSPHQLAEPLALGGHCELIWDKLQVGMGDLSSTWGPQHERITFGVHTPSAKERRDGRGALPARLRRGSVLRYSAIRTCNVRHPDEKPVPLLRELIESSSRDGDVVIDPVCGVGSTVVAAVLAGRIGIGIECEERWVSIAVDRVREAERIAKLAEAM